MSLFSNSFLDKETNELKNFFFVIALSLSILLSVFVAETPGEEGETDPFLLLLFDAAVVNYYG